MIERRTNRQSKTYFRGYGVLNLENFTSVVQIVQGIATVVAIIVGGVWAWRKLFVHAERESSIVPTLIPRIVSCGHDSIRLLEIRCRLVNTGKVPCHFNMERSSWSDLLCASLV